MTEQVNSLTYATILERWLKSAERYLYRCPDRPGLTCYGSGERGWGVQTNQKAFAAYAMLAVEPSFDPAIAGVTQDEVRETALQLLRFSLQSHKAGNYHCTDGTLWGHTWISGLGLERMMHGVEAIDTFLTEEDRESLRNVLISECDWLQDEYKIVAGLYNKNGNNKPESNLWNGALLFRTARMYPDHPRVKEYLEKADQFLINSLSIPSDASSQTLLDGKKVADYHAGANFFESFALNHHGYLNVGYMYICLSNIAMLHFSCLRNGWRAPEALYHHCRELWDLVKLLTFRDGRILRIGGDSRVRNAYCQDYTLPAWLLARNLYGDSQCAEFARGWIQQVVKEMDANGDGSFFSARCNDLARQSPLYYARLESDRALAMSLGMAWNQEAAQRDSANSEDMLSQDGEEDRIEVKQTWHDEYHGAYLHLSNNRIASWVWEASEKPQGLCLPPDASHLAEWRENLSGRIIGLGKVSGQRIDSHDGTMIEGGFVTWGTTFIYTQGLLAEQGTEEEIARNKIVCAALPDDTHMIVLQQAMALDRRIFVSGVKGLHLLVPNDVLNDNHRMYYYEQGVYPVHGYGSKEENIVTGSRWVNVDNRLGIISAYGSNGLSIYRPSQRQIGLKRSLKHYEHTGSLYANEICGIFDLNTQSYDAKQIILDAGYVLQSDKDHQTTARACSTEGMIVSSDWGNPNIRSVQVRGNDANDYLLAANFGESAENVRLAVKQAPWDLGNHCFVNFDNSGMAHIQLQPGEGRLFRL